MTTLAERTVGRRPGTAQLLLEQTVHSTRELWRSRVVVIFTVLFPLIWLVVIGFFAGDVVVDEATGLRLMQFFAPAAVAMGILYATFPTVTIPLALAREQGVLKRVRGTPLPAWIHLAGRIGGALVFALASVLAVLALGVVAYDVQIVWRTLPATLVTSLVAAACYCALGLAVAMIAPSAGTAEAGSIALAVALTFVSGLYSGGSTPSWLTRIADVLPLKPFTDALQLQFNPYEPGWGWDLPALGVLAAWGLGAVLVAARAFSWEPHARKTAAHATAPAADPGPATTATSEVTRVRATGVGRPGLATLLTGQVGWAIRTAWHDPGWIFFSIALPVGIYVLTSATLPGEVSEIDGVPYGLALAAGMIAWGTAVTAFLNTPEAVARARDRGVLKRLRGTPVTPAVYIAGRGVAALLLSLVTGALVLAVGLLFFDLRISWAGVAAAVALLALGTAVLTACGFALAGVLPNSKAVGAVGLAILLPLAFLSNAFAIPVTPAWMTTAGSFLPLKHVIDGLNAVLDPAGPSMPWVAVAVLLAWGALAGFAAARTFSWESRSQA